MNYRNPKYLERYEDVVFDLETAFVTNVANNAYQKKHGYRFVADNSCEVTPFDWHNAQLNVDFKVNKRAGGNIAANDHNGIVNGSHSFIKKLDVKTNGREVYDCCWRAIARQHSILYNRAKSAKFVGCKIGDMRSRFRF